MRPLHLETRPVAGSTFVLNAHFVDTILAPGGTELRGGLASRTAGVLGVFGVGEGLVRGAFAAAERREERLRVGRVAVRVIADVHRERDDGDDEDEGEDPVEDASIADLFHQGIEHCGMGNRVER